MSDGPTASRFRSMTLLATIWREIGSVALKFGTPYDLSNSRN